MKEKNLSSLKIHYTDLYEILLLHNNTQLYKLEKINEFYNLSFENKYIHSKHNPVNEAIRWVDGINVEDEDTISIIGLGLGYYIEPILKKYPSKKIIIIEPSEEIFLHFLSIKDVTTYIENKNIVFIVGKDSNTVRSLFDYYIQSNKIKKIIYTELPVYKKLFINYIEEIYIELKKILSLLQSNISTEISFSRLWLYNTLTNLKHVKTHNNIKCFEDSMEDIPVVIASAGPSLEKNMHLLREVYDKALIIAVGTAASILDSHGIEPHIIMGIDGHPTESKIFKALRNYNPLFIYAHMIHYESIQVYPGDKMWISLQGEKKLECFFEKIGYECPSIVSGGSIAHTALSFAHWLKCSPIILIGQDLAYTDGKLYASGSAHQQDNVTRANYIEEEDIHGNKVFTKRTLLTFKHWFEDYVKIKLGDTKIYNCTEGGLNINGIPNVSFSEIINLYCNEDYRIKDKICRALANNSDVSNTLYEGKFNEYKEQLDVCMKLSKDRLEIIIEILDKELYKEESFDGKIREVLLITDEIEEIEFYNIFIENTGKLYIDAITRSINQQLENEDDIHSKRAIITNGLLTQYSFVNDNLKVAKGALIGEEVEGLYLGG